MPGYDGTGPEGTGPIGRGMGPCGGGNSNGQGRGGGMALRRGWRRGPKGFWRSGNFIADKQSLTHEKAWLERELGAVNAQLDKLGKDSTSD